MKNRKKKMVKIIKISLLFLIIILLKYNFIFSNSKSFFKNNKNKIKKKLLLSKIFTSINRKINNINILFIKGKARFGNFFISINNAIIYCEILHCRKIIIEYNNKIYLNNPIFYKKINFTIEPNQKFNDRDKNSVILDIYFFFINSFNDWNNINRFNIFKKQLLNNLPKVVIHPNDLYIYIRSGDIFKKYKYTIKNYIQPPLCFYVKILDKFKFRKVFIISEDKLNPTIPKILRKYSYIKHEKNKLKLDISFLINSYNLVSATSTFLSIIIKLNDKLKFLWKYDYYSIPPQKYLDSHSLYRIYKMNSTTKFRNLMHPWFNSPNQRKMMIEEKCKNDFDIIR